MFISKKRHLAIIKEMRHYWSSEFDRVRRENVRLTAQLEAKTRFKVAQEAPFPAPVPVFTRPKYGIMHVVSSDPRKTLCGESVVELDQRNSVELRHGFTCLTPQQTKLRAYESWCADCLG